MDPAANVVEHTRRWIETIVIGLNLCPFARRVFESGKIRYAVRGACDPVAVLDDLTHELRALAATPIEEVETTLLILPNALADFLEFNDFLDLADDTLRRLNLVGTIQIASFHPRYQFAGTDPDDLENYTNRSPHPMLHLLREQSISAVAVDPDELLQIPRSNIATLTNLGRERLLVLLADLAPRDGIPNTPFGDKNE